MATKSKGKKAEPIYIHEEYWQQQWVKWVLTGKYNSTEKLVFVRVTCIGAEGCGITDAELMEELNKSEGKIKQSLNRLCEGGELFITDGKRNRRRIYAAKNPDAAKKIKDLRLDGKWSSDI